MNGRPLEQAQLGDGVGRGGFEAGALAFAPDGAILTFQ